MNMKKHSRVFSILIVALMSLVVACSGGGGGDSTPPFSQADLAGTWYVSILQSSPTLSGSAEPGWIRGIATVDSSGTVSVPTMETSAGSGPGPTGVVWTIDPGTGIISESGAGNPDFHGKLAANKRLIVGTATNLGSQATTTTVQLRILQKIDSKATYTVSDIAGKTFMVHQIESGAGSEWMYAEGSTGPVYSGVTTTVSLLSPITKPSGTSPGGDIGALSIDASGIMTLSTNPSFKGMVSPDKTYMIATETGTDVPAYRLTVVQFTNAATNYSLSDLAGTWRTYSFLSFGAWLHSTATIDALGHGIISDEHDSFGSSKAPYSVDLTMTAKGIVSDPTNTTLHGFVSPSRDLAVITQTIDGGPGSMLSVIMK